MSMPNYCVTCNERIAMTGENQCSFCANMGITTNWRYPSNKFDLVPFSVPAWAGKLITMTVFNGWLYIAAENGVFVLDEVKLELLPIQFVERREDQCQKP